MSLADGKCGTGGWTGPLPGDPDNNSILTATAVYGGVQVAWTYPALNPEAVAYVELYRGINLNLAEAPLYRIVTGDTYFDAYPDNNQITYFYWIRIVSVYGTQGDPIGPATATAGAIATQMLGLLEGSLSESALTVGLQSKISNIITVENNLVTEIADRLTGDAALSAALVTAQAEVSDVTTLILNETSARTAADSSQVTATNALAARLAVTGDVGAAIVVAQNTATVALDDAATALLEAQGKNKTFYALTPPVAEADGDLWVDVSDLNKLYRWDGFAWIDVGDTRIVSTAEALTLLQAVVTDPSTGLGTKASVGYVDTAKADAITASAVASQALIASVGGQNFYTGTNPTSVPNGTVGAVLQELKSPTAGDPYQFVAGDQLTISGRIWQDAASAAAGQRAELLIWTADSIDTWKVVGAMVSYSQTPDEQQATITLPVDADMVKVAVTLQHAGGTTNDTGVVSADHIQVEHGAIATPFKTGAAGTDLTPVYAAIQTEQTARADADTAFASDVSTLQTTVGGHTTSIQTTTETVNGIQGKYAVKVDANGYVAGFGLVSESNEAGVGTSEFAIVADKFSIAPVATDPAAADGSPFFHLTVPTVIGGVTVPAGTYMKAAHIHEASITTAKIADAQITSAKIGEAQINNAHITGAIQSSDYAAGSAGWKIDKAGAMEMNNATFRGTLAVKSAASGARLEINNDVIKVYDSSGVLRVKLGNLAA